jgi:hypothetical protein
LIVSYEWRDEPIWFYVAFMTAASAFLALCGGVIFVMLSAT